MSVLIKMEMPKGGYRTVEIAFDADGHPMALADGGNVFDVIPVPPHGRLIEAEPIIKFITDGLNSREFGYDQIKVLAEIQYAPTIIPAEEGET